MNDKAECPTCGKLTVGGGYCEQCGRSLSRCPECKARVTKDAIYCPACGALISEERRLRASQQPIPRLWWLAPIFSPLLLVSPGGAGIVAWRVNMDRNPRKARYILFFGIALSLMIAIAAFSVGWGVVF